MHKQNTQTQTSTGKNKYSISVSYFLQLLHFRNCGFIFDFHSFDLHSHRLNSVVNIELKHLFTAHKMNDNDNRFSVYFSHNSRIILSLSLSRHSSACVIKYKHRLSVYLYSKSLRSIFESIERKPHPNEYRTNFSIESNRIENAFRSGPFRSGESKCVCVFFFFFFTFSFCFECKRIYHYIFVAKHTSYQTH